MSTYSEASLLESILDKRWVCAQGRPWDQPCIDSEPSKAKWLARGNPEETPYVSDSNFQEGKTLSLSPSLCVCSHVLFPPDKHLFCFCLSPCGIHFYKADGPGPCHWPSVPGGLVTRIQLCHYSELTSISGQRTEILLQATADWATLDQVGVLFCVVSMNHQLSLYSGI